MTAPEDFVTINIDEDNSQTPPAPVETPAQQNEDVDALLARLQAGDINNLEQLVVTHQLFVRIHEKLNIAIDNMGKNPSYFSRAAKFWGEVPTWQKIIAGILLAVPALVLGIFIHTLLLLSICCALTILYALSSMILDDHYNSSSDATTSVKEGVLSLANILELIIRQLDAVRQQISLQVDKFRQENQNLTKNNEELSAQVDAFKNQNELATAVNLKLQETNAGLEEASVRLQARITEQSTLLANTQQQYAEAVARHQDNETWLRQQIETLGVQLEQTKIIQGIMEGTAGKLNDIYKTGKGTQELIDQKIRDFARDENAFKDIAVAVSKEVNTLKQCNQLLEKRNSELQYANQEYHKLNESLRTQISQLEVLVAKCLPFLGQLPVAGDSSTSPDTRLDPGALISMGIFAPGLSLNTGNPALQKDPQTVVEFNP